MTIEYRYIINITKRFNYSPFDSATLVKIDDVSGIERLFEYLICMQKQRCIQSYNKRCSDSPLLWWRSKTLRLRVNKRPNFQRCCDYGDCPESSSLRRPVYLWSSAPLLFITFSIREHYSIVLEVASFVFPVGGVRSDSFGFFLCFSHPRTGCRV